jgi:hypothetical protein
MNFRSQPGDRAHMLHKILTIHRDELISRCAEKAAQRFLPAAPLEARHGVALFLEQLTEVLRLEQSTSARPASAAEAAPANTAIGRAAALHGAELMRQGYTIDQVVREYGDVCQSITELALLKKTPIATDEFRSLNRCLDSAIADAVTAFAGAGRASINHRAGDLHTRIDAFADEHRRVLDLALKSLAAIQTGSVGTSGATATVLSHSLIELGILLEHAVSEMRLASATMTLSPALH